MDDIIDELSWRGLIADTTDPGELRSALNSGRVTFYAGFDPTAPGLHIGNLALLLTMRRLQLAGHRPIGLVGGATGLIGDPSGKSAERVLNPVELVAQWVERIRGEVARFLDFDAGPSSAMVVSNLDWTGPMHVLDFLRDIGKHFSVNRMLDRESVKARLEAGGISYTEFSYQLLQALDYLELYRRHGCTLQLGGSDQWGNLVAGVDLIRRVERASAHALAIPLITKADGTKYGKTEGGAIWISPDLMSPYAFYQFWLNVADAEVPGLLRVYSFKSREEIEALERESRDHPAARVGQRAVADELTTLVHGEVEARRAIAASQALFGRSDLVEIDERTLEAAVAEVPSARIFANGDLPTVVDLMAEAEIVPSKSAARRTIAAGGAYLNNRKVTSEDAVPGPGDLLHGRFLILRVGKRTVGAIEVVRLKRNAEPPGRPRAPGPGPRAPSPEPRAIRERDEPGLSRCKSRFTTITCARREWRARHGLCRLSALTSWAFAGVSGPAVPDTIRTRSLTMRLIWGLRPVSRFDLTKARGTPKVLLAPRGWT